MLESLRKNAKYFYFLFGLVIVSFIAWGFSPRDLGIQNDVVVATIGKQKITKGEFWKQYEIKLDDYRQIYKDTLDDKKREALKRDTLDSMVGRAVMLEMADQIGLAVSDGEIKDNIMHTAAFLQDGSFNKNKYTAILRQRGLSPAQYEEILRGELMVQKVFGIIAGSATLSPSEIAGIKGDEQIFKAVRQGLLGEKRNAIFASYINGMLSGMDTKQNLALLQE